MSYALPVEASNKALYATVVSNFYTDSVYNPSTGTMTNVSYYPLQPSMVVEASAKGNKFTESLTCLSQNSAYNCTDNRDCPGPQSSCGMCRKNKCVK